MPADVVHQRRRPERERQRHPATEASRHPDHCQAEDDDGEHRHADHEAARHRLLPAASDDHANDAAHPAADITTDDGEAAQTDDDTAELTAFHRLTGEASTDGALVNDDPELAAGDFSSWMTQIVGAVRGEHGSDVPCGGCTACCSSAQFIHIGPEEVDTLAHIPSELLFPAPRLPRGHVVMGYDEAGKCPMLIDEHCSIYEHRPITCRTYDCRVFPATGLDAADDGKPLIAERARRWRFDLPEPIDRELQDAVRAAASFLRDHPDLLPGGASTSVTQRAALAIGVHELFLDQEEPPQRDEVRVALRPRPG